MATQNITTNPVFSVIIPNYNGKATLGEALTGIFDTGYPGCEVIVVDDGSTDGSWEIIRDFPARLITHGISRGAAAARNTGAETARGNFLLFIDNDVVIPPDTFQLIEEKFKDPEISGVIGLLRPTTRYENICSQYKNFYMHYTYLKLPALVTVFYTSIAAVRREVFAACGGFDTAYRAATIEDMEFGIRMTGRGYRILIEKKLQVDHIRHYTLAGLLKTGFRRAAGLARIALRDRLSRKEKSSYVTTSPAFLAGIALSFLATFFLLLSLLLAGWLWPVLFGASYLAIVLLNYGFLTGLSRNTTLLYFWLGAILIYIDLLTHGLGIIWGLLSFLGGKKY